MALQVISRSAFETLAADLWEHSLNARPAVIGKAVASRSGAKTVEFSVFGTHGFNLESVAGTVSKKKYDFQRLEGIQEAYEHAFGKILFKPQADGWERMLSQKGVRSAAAVRNVLVHRGGVVSKKFKQQTQHQETDNIVVDARRSLPAIIYWRTRSRDSPFRSTVARPLDLQISLSTVGWTCWRWRTRFTANPK